MLELMVLIPRQYFSIILLVFLVACSNESTALPTKTPIHAVVSPTTAPTLTLIPATEFSTQLPPQPTITFITPDAIQVERWKEYEDELAKLVLSNSGAEFPRYEDALCEWDILGRSGQDIYVWAECTAGSGVGRGPAVVYLEEDGSIRDVIYAFPSPSRNVTISKLFPEDIQVKIYTYFSSEWSRELQTHLTYRLTHPEAPPLIILSAIPVIVTSSPLPAQPTFPIITPDAIQLERWREYEVALAMKLLPPNFLRGEVLCEWELLGRFNQEIYVWAFCQSPPYTEDLPSSIASMPAVVHLGNDGDVQGVEIPGSGSAYARDIREMFPPDVQEIIFRHAVDTEKMEAHINSRRENQNPPSIVLSATPKP